MDENKQVRRGGISVQTEDIFPVIKKWLYSDRDIFLREIISNATDAITKLRRLGSLGETELGDDEFRITVAVNKSKRTISVSDNGIGMTGEEFQNYICRIALSGAMDFIQKYEGKENPGGAEGSGSDKNGIIGHFGLGFYSAFMVSETVEVLTKSYTGAPGIRGICNEDGEYEIEDYERGERGTTVVMHVSEEGEDYLSAAKLREILRRYCAFMPEEIYFTDEEDAAANADANAAASADADAGDESDHKPKPINDTTPLWQKSAQDCSDDEYREFYNKVFSDYREPLFHIHINADYPLNFKGILFFPRLNHEYDSLEGQVKLFYNQVFVADNIKEVIPEYLLMMRGVLDCPELPLNVSRSYLQTNTYVSKVSAHIVKKVADKLNSMYNTEREKFEELWGDIKTFVEYACIRDRKFYDRVRGSLIFKLCGGGFASVEEYFKPGKDKDANLNKSQNDENPADAAGDIVDSDEISESAEGAGGDSGDKKSKKKKDKDNGKRTVYYASDSVQQAQYIAMFTAEELQVALLDSMIDAQFITTLEQYESDLKFVRVDAGLDTSMRGEGKVKDNKKLEKLFRKVSGNEKLTVKFEMLKNKKIPALLNISEENRRFADMMKMYSAAGAPEGSFPREETLVINAGSPLIEKLGGLTESDSAKSELIAKQVFTLAMVGQRQLSADELQEFLTGSFELLEMV